MASIYAVQKVSHIYFAYKYIIYTHVITCRNIQASRKGLPLKRDRALFSDLQPKKKKNDDVTNALYAQAPWTCQQAAIGYCRLLCDALPGKTALAA